MSRVKFTDDGLIEFFETKLSESESLNGDSSDEDVEFWWSSIKNCTERMGDRYTRIAGKPSFYPMIYFGGEDMTSSRCTSKNSGLKEARNNIRKIIQDLETFGYENERSNRDGEKEDNMGITINNSLTQNQHMNMEIDLANYPEETREKIKETIQELAKPQTSRDTIKKHLNNLVDLGFDIASLFKKVIGR